MGLPRFHVLLLLGACISCSAPLPDEIPAGFYHLSFGSAATVIDLRTDGTFEWGTNGCDIIYGDAGRWEAGASRVVLLPAEDRERIWWSMGRGAVERIELRPREPAGFIASGVGGGGEFEQEWRPGALCSVCTGDLHPTAPAEPCDTPWLGIDRRGSPRE